MNSFTFALVTMLGYAIFNVIADGYLTHMKPIAVNAFAASGFALFAIAALFIGKYVLGLDIPIPQGWDIALTLGLCGFILFVSELCYFYAYASGGSLVMITTLLMLVPLLSSGMKYLIERKGAPSGFEWLAWGLGASAVLVMAYAQMLKEHPPNP